MNVEVSGGKPVAYDITDIKKHPGATPQGVPSGGDQPAVDYQGTYGRKTIISQGKQNVNPETEVYRALTGDNSKERPSRAVFLFSPKPLPIKLFLYFRKPFWRSRDFFHFF